MNTKKTILELFLHITKYSLFKQSYLQKKFTRNKERDAENLKYYQEQCWRVCTVWECAIRGKNPKQKIENVTSQIIEWLEESSDSTLEIKG